MNGLRFAVGEIAVFAFAMDVNGIPFVGEPVRIEQVGPWPAGMPTKKGPTASATDYACMFSDGQLCLVQDIQLCKLNYPADPASITRSKELEA